MLFNSLIFPVFFLTVLTLYWALPRLALRNALLLAASFLFYGWWDWRFLGLLLLSAGIDYGCALLMSRLAARRGLLLALSLSCNLGILGAFKYFNFFSDNLRTMLGLAGIEASWPTLNVVLPVGISFYTFQALSYTIDVYRGKLPACKDPVKFFLFITFFPQLVAGPIEKAVSLLPQFDTLQRFEPDRATLGLRYMLWGFMLKCVLADNLARIVSAVFDHSARATSAELLFGTYCFAFQIYGDFAGYSYIAVGAAALLGFQLSQNFRFPYLSASVSEFWTRWHISLSSWFREYVYILALGGSRVPHWRRAVNVLATFTLSGLWHGANWTFAVWGLLNGFFYFLWSADEKQARAVRCGACIATFHAICLGWVFFRSKDLDQAVQICTSLASFTPGFELLSAASLVKPAVLMLALLAVELLQRCQPDIIFIDHMPRPARLALYYGLVLIFVFAGEFSRTPFIYFQF